MQAISPPPLFSIDRPRDVLALDQKLLLLLLLLQLAVMHSRSLLPFPYFRTGTPFLSALFPPFLDRRVSELHGKSNRLEIVFFREGD